MLSANGTEFENMSIIDCANASTPILDQGSKAYWYWASVAVIGVISLLGNGMVIYLIVSRRRLHSTANWFILSLAFADFLIGSIVVPSYIVHSFGFETNFSVLILFYNLLFYASVGNLCIMTLDRYIAVTQPLKYVLWMSRDRLALLITAAWLIPTIISLLPLTWSNLDDTTLLAQVEYIYFLCVVIGFEILPCAVMLMVYIRLFLIARHHLRQISFQRTAASCSTSKRGGSGRYQEKSNLKVFFVILLMFVICWILSTYRTLCTKLQLCQGSILLRQVSRLLMFLNSAGNVIVYAILKKDIRKELINVLKWNKQTRGIGEGTTRAATPTRDNR